MNRSLRISVLGALLVTLLSGCGEQAVNAVWQALCDATCTRAIECVGDGNSIAECVSDCLGEIGGAPCERPNEEAVDACVAEIATLSCEALEGGDLPSVCYSICMGCTSPSDCDDSNACTDDSCNPNGACTNTPVSNGTPCGVGGPTCQEGVCMGEFPCTAQGIRDAIASGWGPHTFGCEGPQTVSTLNEITIDNDVILDGEGQLTVDGDDDHPVFTIDGFASVELKGFTITGGRGRSSPTLAGGITNPVGVLILTRSRISGNTGGGVYNGHSGTMTLSETTVSDNTKEGPGAGIYNVGIMTLTDSTVSGNVADDTMPGGLGGGIYNTGTLALIGSTVSGNAVSYSAGYAGGGIHNVGSLSLTDSAVIDNTAGDGGGISTGADTTLTRSLVSANTAVEGGGIRLDGGTLTLFESTLSGNTAIAGGGIFVPWGSATFVRSTVFGNSSDDDGGGILLFGGTVTLTNSTISRNTSNNHGGGISSAGGEGVTLTSCTIAENSAVVADAIYMGSTGTVTWTNTLIQGDCSAPASVVGGYNIESPGDTCGFDQEGDQSGVTAVLLDLQPLADNGGPTQTHAITTDSAAFNAGSCEVDTDQRGVTRPQGPTCDVGAFELEVGP